MKNHPLICFLREAAIFTDADKAKLAVLVAESGRLLGHMRAHNVIAVEHEFDTARITYLHDPSDANFEAAQKTCHKFQLQRAAEAMLLPVCEGAHVLFLKRELLPWAVDLTARLRAAVKEHFGPLLEGERQHSLEMLGTSDTSDVVQAHMERIENHLATLPERLQHSISQPYFTPQSFLKMLGSVGIVLDGVDLIQENFSPSPMPETEGIKALRRAGLPVAAAPGGPDRIDDNAAAIGEANVAVEAAEAAHEAAVRERNALRAQAPGKGNAEALAAKMAQAEETAESTLDAHRRALEARDALLVTPKAAAK